MPIYRVTFSFSGGGEGWTETHQIQQTDPNIDNWKNIALNVATMRAEMLGDPFYIYSVRIAAYENDDGTKARRSVRLYKGPPGGRNVGWYSSLFGKKNNGAEPSVVALQAIGYASPAADALYRGNSNQTFLGGPQDDAVDNDGGVFPAKTNLAAAFPMWAASLKLGAFGWGASVQRQTLPLQTIVQSAGTSGTVTLTPAANVTVPFGKWYPARISGVNLGRSPLNGQAIVYAKDATTLITKEVIGIPTTQTGGQIVIYDPLTKFIPYGQIELQLRTVKHKRGKSPEARPGRARKRIRG